MKNYALTVAILLVMTILIMIALTPKKIVIIPNRIAPITTETIDPCRTNPNLQGCAKGN